ncbi:DUF6241 domain-containing protein [Pseudalkalibacillus hwajinpoensis]|uniref:Uncharacterized protein n=1 Tax=Guptibacillus hwajinpoensis TaxID=208199 RepID=A0A4V5Q1L8_9BACL|nr:DUF6241 domain-containing protein [Pseudalkalibacillus hwajinpoensis]TKD70778.1 hypothetical protein FBF83_09190 [Pseudalkalibacillus hwajinpoensis]
MPSTKTLLLSISIIVILSLGLGYWLISDLNAKLVEEKGETKQSGEQPEEEIDPDRYVDDGANSTADDTIPSESHFMTTLHGMTHQKVYADEKWTLVEMTDKRIEDMLAILDKVKGEGEYEHYDFYYKALTKWKKGDFQNAVEIHNEIWSMENGNVGRASRLLTANEEQAFVDEHYD